MFTSSVPTTSWAGAAPAAGNLQDGSSCRAAARAAGEPSSAAHAATKHMTSMPYGMHRSLSYGEPQGFHDALCLRGCEKKLAEGGPALCRTRRQRRSAFRAEIRIIT